MWSEPIVAVFTLQCSRLSDRNKLRRDGFVLAHASGGIAVHHSREDKGGAPSRSRWAHEAGGAVQTMVDQEVEGAESNGS